MVPAIAAVASTAIKGFVGATNTFSKATGKYEQATIKTENFISSIAKYSPQVQAGQAQAEIVKIRADLASDKVAGKEMRTYLIQAAKADAATQQVATYFYKWSAEILTVINGFIQTIMEKILPIMESIDEWKNTWWDMYYASLRDFADTFRDILGETLTRKIIEWVNREEAERAAEKAPDRIPPIGDNFFSMIVPIERNTAMGV